MNLLKKLFFYVCLTISILLFFYTFYKSELYWHGVRSDYYLTYYLISGFLILFFIITFYLSDKVKTYLIITLTSVVFSLYAFETYSVLQKLNNEKKQLNKKIKLYKQQTGKEYDTRSMIEIFNDLNNKYKNVVTTVAPSFLINTNKNLLPLSSISNSKTINCNENGYYSIYQSDRYGFNNPDSEWDQPEIEYLLIGDSFTQGNCVNRPNDIGSVLRKLSKKPVLNLAYRNNGALIEYAVLREYLGPNVKNVVWIYYEGNDIFDLDRELKSEILIKYLKDLNFSQNLKSKQNQIDEISTVKMINDKKEQKWHNHFAYKFSTFIKISNLRSFLFLPKSHPQPQPQFIEILKFAKDLVLKNNSKFYFVYLPNLRRYKTHISTDFFNSSYVSIKKIVNGLNIPFIDIHKEVFLKESNPLKLAPFKMPMLHYNVEGYKKTVEAIYKFTSK